MPTPAYPGYFPFTDGNTIVSDDVFGLFYNGSAPGEALNVINGYLVGANLNSSVAVDFRYTQPGSHMDCESAAGTAALDYMPALVFPNYQDVANQASSADEGTPLQPIPGGCKTFYMPWEGSVLFNYQIFWTAQNNVNNGYKSSVFFMLDSAFQEGECRFQGKTIYTSELRGYAKARAWSGHIWLDLDAGWHDAGLGMLADSRTGLNRVHSVNISLLKFKTGAAL